MGFSLFTHFAPVGVNKGVKDFPRQSLHFAARTSTPKRKYQGIVQDRLLTQYDLNEMVLPIVFQR